MKVLDLVLMGVLSVMGAPSWAQQTQTVAQAPTKCTDDACRSAEGLLFQVRSLGDDQPVAAGRSAAALQANRRVDVTALPVLPGAAKVAGRFSMELPSGGVIWATEDPTLAQPALSVQAASVVPFDDGQITQPVPFQGYTNYAAFMQRLEVRVYRGDDTDLVTPLAVIELPVQSVSKATWNGRLPAGTDLRPGDTLRYVTRAYGPDGNFDETMAHQIQLVTPADFKRNAEQVRDQAQKALGMPLDTSQAQDLKLQDDTFGQNGLRLQNIGIHGSRVRIYGRDVPRGDIVRINGQDFPVDQERKFVAEFLEPIGKHDYAVDIKPVAGPAVSRTLAVDVTGRYSFTLAMADLTLSKSNISRNVAPDINTESTDDNFIRDGRLAFYSKNKFKGRYLITAQADTTDRDLDGLFNGFLKADPRPQDVFRNLDPDQYYPTYGDDSSTYRDVDTQGRLYLRVDWDQNQALWGNYNTGLTDTVYAQYNRSLYGAALAWRSNDATQLGDPRSRVKLFGSQAQSVPGHNEFLGTGGSLYYLRQTDILPGSDVVSVATRDPRTGRILGTQVLQRGIDYEIDTLQGRIILTRPLAQVTRDNVTSITTDAPLDGYDQFLFVDYEYVPVGFDAHDNTMGLRGKQWFGEHLAVGGTYVNEGRNGDDYTMAGADVTLQAGRGTYLKVEKTHTQAVIAPILYSDNGGFSFVQKNQFGAHSGDAEAVEARANLKELGWVDNDWSVGAWWRNVDPGFSANSYDTGSSIREYGANFLGYLSKSFSLYGQYSHAERDGEVLEQNQLTAQWRMDPRSQLGFELRQLSQQGLTGGAVNPLLGALSYDYKFSQALDLYGVGQYTLNDDHGAYARNDRVTAGAKYQFGNRSSVGGEVSDGSRGRGALINADYQLSTDHDLYGAYRYSTDTTAPDPLFNPDQQGGWTLGQRWRLSNLVSVHNESQFLKDPGTQASGLAHTFGMDYYPAVGWNLGFTLQEGKLQASDGLVTRHAYSINGGRTDERTDWASKVEYRQDQGAEQRHQWATTNRLYYKVNDDWRIAVRANYANTDDQLNAFNGARLAEVNLGFAFRPHDNTRWAAFGRYTYLYDLASPAQVGGDTYDQRTQVVSMEALYRLDPRWQLVGKLASRWGDARTGRGTGPWLDSRADFAAAQVRYHLIAKWDALVEYRWLGVQEGGDKSGWLAGVDRQISQNFKFGVGYNFTDFSDDLTHVRYDSKGWFLNFTGYY